ncbi:MAG: hypothetical protein M1820_001137 [Bogoriella megaspora]|nr:MAG: hypothetical protein M1820_001137 [Bogoriella megaspora]
MRLLQRQRDGSFYFTEDLFNETITQCPYAILSHRWGQPDEEVTFEDIEKGSGQYRAGYQKIVFCAEQARKDGLEYFWIDSCCIKKSSDAELSEAINSMYRWYSSAARCYVYLPDVSTTKRKRDDETIPNKWEMAFRSSEWFKRGWTLQELLAPTSVEFFSREQKRLGDKRSLSQQISEITGIPLQALEGTQLSQFSVDERFKWAKKRSTTRAEDWAYCLLGVFDISMPAIYGEGKSKAVDRLKKAISESSHVPKELLERLPAAKDASFNSLAKQHEPTCLPNTRVDLLKQIHNWAGGDDQRYLFWLNGLAGTGKSTIARTERLGASFFFSRGGGDAGNAGNFVTTITLQFASSIPALRGYIHDVVSEHRDTASLSIRDQWQMLVIGPLSKLQRNGHSASYILVVDALDECDDESNIRILVQLFSDTRSLEMARLRVFLTSRPEVPIRCGLSQVPDMEHKTFILHNILRSVVDHDISSFLEHQCNTISQTCSLSTGWPGGDEIRAMTQTAGGLFIWAATACRFLSEGKRFAPKRLDMILKGSGNGVTEPEKRLDVIYTSVLEHSISPHYTDEEEEEVCHTLRQIIGCIATLYSPLSVASLSRLLSLPEQCIVQTLNDLHSILDVPEERISPLRLHHPSFRDFILNQYRCKDPRFRVHAKQVHQALAEHCLHLMSESLKQDVCGVEFPGKLVSSVERSQVEQCLPLEAQYACLYWVEHVRNSGMEICDNDQMHEFLKMHLLHWLEALGWMRKVPDGVIMITLLESLTLSHDCPLLHAFIHDARRFSMFNRQGIEQAPLQVYSSALCFAPANSVVRKEFESSNIPQWIQNLPVVPETWSAALGTLEGHSGPVTAVAFAPDGKRLISSSEDRTIRVWDPLSGQALAVFTHNSDYVNTVAFTRDSRHMASGSADSTVFLWDIESGEVQAKFEGHVRQSGPVTGVAFSFHTTQVLSGFQDTNVFLWDIDSGRVLRKISHSSRVNTVTFSPNGKWLASGCENGTVYLRDAASGDALASLNASTRSVSKVVFSPSSKHIVANGGSSVHKWEAKSGKLLATLKYDKWVDDIVFSPDGKQLAVVCKYAAEVWLRDAQSDEMLSKIRHSDYVGAIAFSPDGKSLASASESGAVWLWDIQLIERHQRHGERSESSAMLQGHSDKVTSIVVSPNGKQLASTSRDKTVRVWDAESGQTLRILKGHTETVWKALFSEDSNLIASCSVDGTVRLWDIYWGRQLKTLYGHSRSVWCIQFSPNNKQLASASYDGIVCLWSGELGEALIKLKGHEDSVYAITYSPDGRHLASGSIDQTIRLWDSTTGEALATFIQERKVSAVAFSIDGKWITSGSLDPDLVYLWDVESGSMLAEFEDYSSSSAIECVALSPDGKYIASASDDNTVRLWNVASGEMEILESDAAILELSFSTDGLFLNTNRGSISLARVLKSSMVRDQEQVNLFVSDQWIKAGPHNLLWLPAQYRSRYVATTRQNVSLGGNSDQMSMSMIRFDANFLNGLKQSVPS